MSFETSLKEKGGIIFGLRHVAGESRKRDRQKRQTLREDVQLGVVDIDWKKLSN